MPWPHPQGTTDPDPDPDLDPGVFHDALPTLFLLQAFLLCECYEYSPLSPIMQALSSASARSLQHLGAWATTRTCGFTVPAGQGAGKRAARALADVTVLGYTVSTINYRCRVPTTTVCSWKH